MSMPGMFRSIALLVLLLPSPAVSEAPVVRGVVLAEDGSSLAGAEARLIAAPSNFESVIQLLDGSLPGRTVAAARADRSGRFHIAVPNPGIYQVWVEARSHITMRQAVLAVTESIDLPPVVMLRDAGARVRVIGDSKPVAGAAVLAGSATKSVWERVAIDGWNALPRMGWTGADGTVGIPRARGERLEVEVWPPHSVVPRGGELTSEVIVEVDVSVGRRWTLEIRGSDEEPIAGAVIAVGRRVWPRGRTDAQGRWQLPDDGSGSQRVHVFSDDGRYLSFEIEEPSEPLIRLQLPDLQPWSGVVHDAVSQKPVTAALVWSPRNLAGSVLTDTAGRFELPAAAGDQLRLFAVADGYLMADGSITAGSAGVDDSTLALKPAARLEGRVLDGETSFGGARLTLYRQSENGLPPEQPDGMAISDVQGRFRFNKLAGAAGYTVIVESPEARDRGAPGERSAAGRSPAWARDHPAARSPGDRSGGRPRRAAARRG